MPRGRKKKEETSDTSVATEVVEGAEETMSEAVSVVAEVVPEPVKEAPRKVIEPKLTAQALAIAESRKVLNIPLPPSQEFFESPEGFIVIGEKGRGRVWCREANNFKGMWINPKR